MEVDEVVADGEDGEGGVDGDSAVTRELEEELAGLGEEGHGRDASRLTDQNQV